MIHEVLRKSLPLARIVRPDLREVGQPGPPTTMTTT